MPLGMRYGKVHHAQPLRLEKGRQVAMHMIEERKREKIVPSESLQTAAGITGAVPEQQGTKPICETAGPTL